MDHSSTGAAATGGGSGGPGGNDGAPGDEFSISRSNALLPLLLLFAASVLAISWIIVRAEPFVPEHGAAADRAYRPADFPAVFGRDDALAGLDGASGAAGARASGDVQFPVPPPPFRDPDMFPCSECHKDLTPNPKRRALKQAHEEIVLLHDAEHRWCLDCHDAGDRDHLRLASGALVPFTESYRLCGQCHGTQYRDWRNGIHGKRTGFWDGPKRYLLCVHCHDPHAPKFMDFVPLPPPVRPQFLRAPGDARPTAAPAGAGRPAGSTKGKTEGDHGGR